MDIHLFFLEYRCPVLFCLKGLISWLRTVKIIIQKNRQICACDSGPSVPYLPDVSMFPRRRKEWIILEVGKGQEKEPQYHNHRKVIMVMTAQAVKLEFSQISKVLLREKSRFSIIWIILLPSGNWAQDVHLGTKVLRLPHRAVVWSQRAIGGKRE